MTHYKFKVDITHVIWESLPRVTFLFSSWKGKSTKLCFLPHRTNTENWEVVMAKRIKPQTSIEYRTDYVSVFCHGIVMVLNKKSFHQAPVSGLEPGIYINSNRCNHRSTGHLKLFRTSFHGDESLWCHTLVLYTRRSRFKSQSGSSTLGQSTLSSLPSLLEETLWCEPLTYVSHT